MRPDQARIQLRIESKLLFDIDKDPLTASKERKQQQRAVGERNISLFSDHHPTDNMTVFVILSDIST